MKLFELMDFEADNLLEVLRYALHCSNQLQNQTEGDTAYWHGYHRHLALRALETIAPKKPCDAVIQQQIHISIQCSIGNIEEHSDEPQEEAIAQLVPIPVLSLSSVAV